TTVEGSVILDSCTIGRACRIKDSILSKGVSLQDEVHVLDNSVIGDNCLIEKDNQLKRAVRVFPGTYLKEGSIKF
ncbi:mannose-1-phosphate guanylyltransferase, partial [Candidatus Hakubella thermalkaliphila]